MSFLIFIEINKIERNHERSLYVFVSSKNIKINYCQPKKKKKCQTNRKLFSFWFLFCTAQKLKDFLQRKISWQQ